MYWSFRKKIPFLKKREENHRSIWGKSQKMKHPAINSPTILTGSL
ncbi:hypothetical protein NitYY0810_C0931 [Nitratiruptor sp. YY08-10]|nr:hypothetical protein NitYY0810_C0931 [Nitratiruptor sp. YY08-10]